MVLLTVGLGVYGCSADAGNELESARPVPVFPVVIDAGPGCPGAELCACSATVPCTERFAVCTPDGICRIPDGPCGNCNAHGPSKN